MDADVIIVGAGAAGLTAALRLRETGRTPLVLESLQRVGGRLATDYADGYQFDHGFQVLQTAYPAVRRWLDLDALGVRAFEPGAQVLLPGGKRALVADPFRRPGQLFASAFSPVGSIGDKLQVLRLVAYVRSRTPEQLFATEEASTAKWLKDFGFGESLIEQFFRPFYGGIYLERELLTSSRMLLFTFKMFAEGEAVLPKGGIRAVAEQMVARLPEDAIRLGEAVLEVGRQSVVTAGGERLSAKHVIDTRPNYIRATSRQAAWNSTVVVYFSADAFEMPARTLGLVPGGCPVGLVTELSSVQADYAPYGKRLICVSLQAPEGRDLDFYVAESRKSLQPWFGAEFGTWAPLRHYEVRYALPLGLHAKWDVPPGELVGEDGVIRAGDGTLAPSLQHAMKSGELAADACVAAIRQSV